MVVRWIAKSGYHFTGIPGVLIQTMVSTILVLITSEFIPKVFFQIYANSLIKFFAAPAYLFYQLFYYVSAFSLWISNFLLRIFFKTEGDKITLFFSKAELGNYLAEQMNTVEGNSKYPPVSLFIISS